MANAPPLETFPNPRPERDFEIGRQQANLVSLGFHQHVRKNRNRVLALDDALEKLQFSQKVSLPGNEFHRRVDDLEQSGVAAFPMRAWTRRSLNKSDQKGDKKLYKK